MAYTTKAKNKNDDVEIKEEKAVVDTVTISKEEFEQMKVQMQALMQMMAMGNKPVQEKKAERYITFVNMCKGRFVLKGSSFYTIEHQFESRKFIEREAKMIVNNMPNSIKDGKIYILDADFVKDCELESIYENLLTDKDMIELLNREPAHVVEVYKNACEGQKKIIVDMIENKKLKGEPIDANIVVKIGELSGKDLINIEKIEEMKE